MGTPDEPGIRGGMVHVVAGVLLLAFVVLLDPILGHLMRLGRAQALALLPGLALIVVGSVPRLRSIRRRSTNLCVSVISILALVGVGEGVCRIAGVDFAREESRWREMPPFNRQPIVPAGEVFFRRPGPQTWTGQVLGTAARLSGFDTDAYDAEPVQTVAYDSLGFRNPDGMDDWDLVIAGDSFTESGYLPPAELFTTLVGESTGLRTLNLGVGYTGPLTQLHYLRSYGLSGSTRIAIIVFFEGNDLDDLGREYARLIRWQTTGVREYRRFHAQPSPTRAVVDAVESLATSRRTRIDAYFRSASGPVPVSFIYALRDRSQVSEETARQLEYFFREYAAFGAENHVETWLVYMPTKRIVLDGALDFTADASPTMRAYRPHDIPDWIADLCRAHGVRFVDVTPALIGETEAGGRLLYNGLFDSHLNAEGSRVVAATIARQLMAAN